MTRPVTLIGLCLALALGAACRKSPTGPSSGSAVPSCCVSYSGTGDTVFDMPKHVARVRITGTFAGGSSNFVIWVGDAGTACGVIISAGCRLLVNDLLGTLWNKTAYDGTVQTGGGGIVSIQSSSGVAWTISEMR